MGRAAPKKETKKTFRTNPFADLRTRNVPVVEEPAEEKPKPKKTEPLDSEEEAFAKAMEGVAPLNYQDRIPRTRRPGKPKTRDEEQAIIAHLQDLVDGTVPFDIADTDEYIEGSIQGFDKRVIRRLRRGEFSVQRHLDLHGYTRDDARDQVARFIRRSVNRGLRCVLIVHGRGLRSKNNIPVLKEKLKAWLTRGSIGAHVLAFASARPYDGGTGAVYVLLRR